MSTKEEPGPFDGMERAEPGEPVFTLRAHDPLAAGLVMEWVRQRRAAIIAGNLSAEKEELELIQCREAEEIAWRMQDWRAGTVEKVAAPVEKAKPIAYSGHASSTEELAAKRRYDVVKAATGVLHNALSEVTDAAHTLEPYGFAVECAVILEAAGDLKAVANHIGPKRASYSASDPEPEPFDTSSLTRARA